MASVGSGGTWQCSPGSDLADGVYTVVAVASGGNVVCPSNSDVFTIDTVAPPAPGFTAPASPTSQTRPTFSGTGVPGDTVQVSDAHGELCSAVVAQNGTWSCAPSAALSDGSYALTAVQVDSAGNQSPPATQTVVINTSKPNTPTLIGPASPTRVAILPFSGQSDVGTTVTVRDSSGDTICTSGAVTGASAGASSGPWSCSSGHLADGSYTFTAIAQSATNVPSNPSLAITIVVDTTPPAAPVLDAVPSPTAQHFPLFSGSAEAGSQVAVFEGNTQLCSGPSVGNFSCVSTVSLANGAHTVTADATDAAGNVSAMSAAVSFTVDDTVAPAPTLAPLPTPPGGQPGFTAQTEPTFSGTGVPGDQVTARIVGSVPLCSATVAGDGSWSCASTVTLTGQPATAYSVEAVQQAPAGTHALSPPSAPIEFTVDTHVPATPELDPPASPSSDHTPTFTGSAEAQDDVEVDDAQAGALCTTSADAQGNFGCAPAQALADGTYQLTARSYSRAGISSATSTPARTLTIFTATALAAPTIDQPVSPTRNSKPTLSGTASAGVTVTVHAGSQAILQQPDQRRQVELRSRDRARRRHLRAHRARLRREREQLARLRLGGPGDRHPRAGRAGHPRARGRERARRSGGHRQRHRPSGDAGGAHPRRTRRGQHQRRRRRQLDARARLARPRSPHLDRHRHRRRGQRQPVRAGHLLDHPRRHRARRLRQRRPADAALRARDAPLLLAASPPGRRPRARQAGRPALSSEAASRRPARRRPDSRPPALRPDSSSPCCSPLRSRGRSSSILGNLQPPSDGEGLLGVEGARPPVEGDPRASVNLWLDNAFQPLVFQANSGARDVLVDNRVESFLGVQLHLWRPLSLAVQLPFLLAQTGDFSALPPSAQPAGALGGGVGDLRLTPRLAILRQETAPVDLGAQVSLTLPTASSAAYTGDTRVQFEMLAALARDLDLGNHAFELLGNVLVRLRAPEQIVDVKTGNELGLRLGFAWLLDRSWVAVPRRLFVEAEGESALRGSFAAGTVPAEWRAGASFCAAQAVSLDLGAGTALGDGIGAPRARVIFGLGYAPEACGQAGRDRFAARAHGAPPPAAALAVNEAAAAPDAPTARAATVSHIEESSAAAPSPASPRAEASAPANASATSSSSASGAAASNPEAFIAAPPAAPTASAPPADALALPDVDALPAPPLPALVPAPPEKKPPAAAAESDALPLTPLVALNELHPAVAAPLAASGPDRDGDGLGDSLRFVPRSSRSARQPRLPGRHPDADRPRRRSAHARFTHRVPRRQVGARAQLAGAPAAARRGAQEPPRDHPPRGPRPHQRRDPRKRARWPSRRSAPRRWSSSSAARASPSIG